MPGGQTSVANSQDTSTTMQSVDGDDAQTAPLDQTGPEGTVRAFLAAMAARDLTAAETMLSPDFSMVFPGGRSMTRLAELIDWATSRYRFVAKSIDRVETLDEGDRATVFVTGTLHGEWPDGEHFAGIRFIDRFVVTADGIAEQDVWNDLADYRAGDAQKP